MTRALKLLASLSLRAASLRLPLASRTSARSDYSDLLGTIEQPERPWLRFAVHVTSRNDRPEPVAVAVLMQVFGISCPPLSSGYACEADQPARYARFVLQGAGMRDITSLSRR